MSHRLSCLALMPLLLLMAHPLSSSTSSGTLSCISRCGFLFSLLYLIVLSYLLLSFSFLTLTLYTNLHYTLIQVKEVTGGLQRDLSSSLSSLSLSSYPSTSNLSSLPNDNDSYSCNTLPRKCRKIAREPKYRSKAIKTLLQWVQRRTSKWVWKLLNSLQKSF